MLLELWPCQNCVSATFSASTPEALRMTAQQRGVRRRPANHADPVPAKSAIMPAIFGAGFLLSSCREVRKRPQHSKVLRTIDGLRVGRTPDRRRPTASRP